VAIWALPQENLIAISLETLKGATDVSEELSTDTEVVPIALTHISLALDTTSGSLMLGTLARCLALIYVIDMGRGILCTSPYTLTWFRSTELYGDI
jgi:hypothetical protein